MSHRLKGSYIGDYVGDHYRAYEGGYYRRLDYGSHESAHVFDKCPSGDQTSACMGSVLFEELGLFHCSKGSSVEEGLDFWNVSTFRRTVLGIAAHFAELAEPSCNHQRDGPSLSLTKQRSTYASTFQTDAVLYL